MKPTGITHRHIARLFLAFYSIDQLAYKFKCFEWEIENAIRKDWQRLVARQRGR